MLDAFLADAVVHYSIVEAIATGDGTWKGITNRTGRNASGVRGPHFTWRSSRRVVCSMMARSPLGTAGESRASSRQTCHPMLPRSDGDAIAKSGNSRFQLPHHRALQGYLESPEAQLPDAPRESTQIGSGRFLFTGDYSRRTRSTTSANDVSRGTSSS